MRGQESENGADTVAKNILISLALLLAASSEVAGGSHEQKSVREVFQQYKEMLLLTGGIAEVGTFECSSAVNLVPDLQYPNDNCIIVLYADREKFFHMKALFGERFILGGYMVWIPDPATDPAVSVHN